MPYRTLAKLQLTLLEPVGAHVDEGRSYVVILINSSMARSRSRSYSATGSSSGSYSSSP